VQNTSLKPQTKNDLEVCVSTMLGTNHVNNDIKWDEMKPVLCFPVPRANVKRKQSNVFGK